MSIAPAHAAAFYREVSEHQVVWAISDSGGFAAPLATDGKRAMPFWSSQSRANAIIAGVSAYAGFHPVAIDWKAFCERWVPGLTRDGLLASNIPVKALPPVAGTRGEPRAPYLQR